MTILGVYFTIHMIGLVLWLGAAFLLPIAIIPAARGLEVANQAKFIELFTKRYIPWFVIGGVAVGLTGLAQTLNMIADLNIPITIAKHFAILPLIAVSVFIWFYLAREFSKPITDINKLWRRLMIYSWIQAGLGVIVLILTGWLTG